MSHINYVENSIGLIIQDTTFVHRNTEKFKGSLYFDHLYIL